MNQKQLPATIDEAVGVAIATLSDDDKARIVATSKPDLIGLHFSDWGRGFGTTSGFGRRTTTCCRQFESVIHPFTLTTRR